MTAIGFMAELVWRPVVPPALIALMAAAMIGLAVFIHVKLIRENPRRGVALLVLRVAAILMIAAVLLGPSFTGPALPDHVRRSLAVLLDTSASMQTPDCGGRSRFDVAAKDWLGPANIAGLRRAFDIRFLALDETLGPLPLTPAGQLPVVTPTGRQSKIGDDLEQAISQFPGGAGDVLLISDGRDTTGGSFDRAAVLAAAGGVRVHTVALGGPVSHREIAIVAMPSRETFLAGEEGSILVRVYQAGFDGTAATLRVRSPEHETAVQLRLGSSAVTTVTVPTRHAPEGVYRYQFSLDRLAGQSAAAAPQTVFVRVTGKRIRVLLLEGEPGWDAKFIAQALRQDDRIDLAAVSQLAPGKRETILTRSSEETASRPVSAADLAKYDVIVLGRHVERLLAPAVAAVLAGYVDHGGHVIFSRGQAYEASTPAETDAAKALSVIEPAAWGETVAGDAPLVVAAGARNEPLFVFDLWGTDGKRLDASEVFPHLPPVTGVVGAAHLKAASRVLLKTSPAVVGGGAGARPAMVQMEYGHGSVAAMLVEGLWRWRLLTSGMGRWSGVYDALWSNLVRRLVLGGDFQPGERVSLELSAENARLGEEVSFNITARQLFPEMERGGPRLGVIDDAGGSQGVALAAAGDGRWKGVFRPGVAGVYRAVLDASPLGAGRVERSFSVNDVDVERVELSADPEGLARLAEQTGGVAFHAGQASALPGLLDAAGGAEVGVSGVPGVRWAWDNPWLLAVLLTCLGVDWLIRRRSGWL